MLPSYQRVDKDSPIFCKHILIEYTAMENKMKGYLPQIDEDKLRVLFDIETAYKAGKLLAEQVARNKINVRTK